MAVTVATDGPTACCRVSGVKRANSALRVFGSFSFLFLLPSRRVHAACKRRGTLRASAAEIVHTEIVHTYMHMHMMNSGRSRDPPPYHPW